MAENVLEDFMVRLGFKVDPDGEKKFDKALTVAVTKANLLARGIEEMAVAVAKSVARVVGDFDRLTYASARTGTSVAGLKSLQYGFSQLGGSAQQAMAVVENFTRTVRMNPGLKGFVKQLGVDTAKEGADQLLDVVEKLNAKPYHIAVRQAEMLGIDENSYSLLSRQLVQFKAFRDSMQQTARVIGLDGKKAAESSTALSQAWGKLAGSASVVAERFAADLMPHVTRFLNYLNDWVDRHGAEIGKFLDDLKGYGQRLADVMGELGRAVEPIAQRFQAIAESLTGEKGLKASMEVFAAFLVGTWLVKVLGAFGAIGTGWRAMLLRLGIPIGIGVAASGGGHMTPEGYREAIQNDPGRAKADAELNSKGGSAKRWWKRNMPTWLGGDPASASEGSKAPIAGKTFRDKAPGVMQRLMDDFGLSKEEAGVVLGNLGHESAGFTAFKEGGNGPGRGWAQWTDPGRKRRFFDYAKQRGLEPESDEANYGFLKWELQNTHRSSIAALKRAETVQDKMIVFEDKFENAGVKAYGSRNRYMRDAIKAFDDAQKAPPVAKPSTPIPPLKVPAGGGITAEQFNERFGNSSPMGATTNNSSADNRRFDIQHKTEIRVDGSGDPSKTASTIKESLGRGNTLSLRNAMQNYR